MARKNNKEIKLTSYNDLFGIEETEVGINKVMEISLSQIHSFKNHPFKVCDNEEMFDLVKSIAEHGILNPALVRLGEGGGYELIAGHRRKRACEINGLTTMPVIVRNYTDDQAVIVMVDSNIQREHILPSEKAFAYQMKLEAIKHQGIKNDFLEDAATLVGKELGDSARKVQRYIRLTKLLPELLELVDIGKIKVTPAVFLSFLSIEEQRLVYSYLKDQVIVLNGEMAEKLKTYSEQGELNSAVVKLVLGSEKKEIVKLTLSEKRIKKYFPNEYGKKQIEEIIYNLLEEWKKKEGGAK